MILRPTKTVAGRKATFNASGTGTELVITHMSLGDKGGPIDDSLTKLRSERERSMVVGSKPTIDTIHIDAIFNSPAAYWVREVGFWAGTTLVYYWSTDGVELGYKAADFEWLMGLDLLIDPKGDGPITITAAPPNMGLTMAPALAAILQSLSDTNRTVLNHRSRLDAEDKELAELKGALDPYPQYLNNVRYHKLTSDLRSALSVDTPTELTVGVGKNFNSIEAAYAAISGKSLRAEVRIKVDDGTYNTTGIALTEHPHAHQIRLEGNPANPGACTINFVPDSNKVSHGLILRGMRGMQLAGFRLVGQSTATNWTHRCLRLDGGARVWVQPGTLIVEGGGYGIQLDDMALLSADRITVSGCADWHVYVGSGSTAGLDRITINGGDREKRTAIPLYVNENGYTTSPSGILSNDGSRVWAGQSTLSNLYHALWAQNASFLWCDITSIDQVYYGAIAKTSGVIWSHWWGVTRANPTARRSQVRNAKTIAYLADQGGRIYAPGARAADSSNGFYASTQGLIQASGSITERCSRAYYAESGALIEAYDTRGRSAGCATLYSPAGYATLGNDNGQIRFS